jgi:hypothetical protein
MQRITRSNPTGYEILKQQEVIDDIEESLPAGSHP